METKPRRVSLSPDALEIVKPRASGRAVVGPWLFPKPGDPANPVAYATVDHAWRGIRERAELEGVRLHDLRHAFASAAAAAGMSLPEIGAMLGHKSPATTQRYAHLADEQNRQHVATIGERIQAAAEGRGKVVPLRRR